ncbi:MAG: response regulator transcription factor [Acidobacteriota bacterium]
MTDCYRILAVDDDRSILALLERILVGQGFDVWLAESGEEALEILERRGLPHLMLVDLLMPGVGGLELCRRIKSWSDVPLMVITAVDTKETLVDVIEGFAEDYIVKPFHPAEVAARVRRILQRIGDFSYVAGPRSTVDDRLSVDFAGQRVWVEGEPVDLTPTESKLLYLLMKTPGRPLPSSYLVRRLWPTEEVFEDALRVHLHRLRSKIEPQPSKPSYVRTQRGVGYVFSHPGSR